jgi:hypothetical protein
MEILENHRRFKKLKMETNYNAGQVRCTKICLTVNIDGRSVNMIGSLINKKQIQF